MVLDRSRYLFLAVSIASIGILATAFYLEWQVGLVPCSLSQLQRFFVGALAVSSVIAFLYNPSRRIARRYLLGHTLLITLGGTAALRHLWVQANGEQPKVVCQPGIDYLMSTLPWDGVIKTLLLGTPECARVNWTLLDLSVPEWSLLALAGLLLLTLVGWLRALR